MLTQEEHVEIHALNKRGWTISEIARHTGRDRKTIRAYLSGDREPGVHVAVESDPFDRIEPYVRQRLVDDHGLWATTLFDEVQDLGYDRSYPTFTRHLRQRAPGSAL
jgi:transposase